MQFTVEFGKSSSMSFDLALAIAKKAPTFRILTNLPQERYSATFTQLVDFIELAQYVRGWKSARFLLDGRPLSLLENMNLFRVNECYTQKQEFLNKSLYCFIGQDGSKLFFPCRRIYIRGYEFGEGKFGKVMGNTVILDKVHLKFVLEQQARQSMSYCCPDMNMEQLLNIVDNLPEELPLTEEGFFGIRTIEKGLFGTLKLEPSDEETKKLEDLLKDIDEL